ncbi:MAG TPA: hypothetical protein VJA21_10995 [Verrucomicrobiae bacterium]
MSKRRRISLALLFVIGAAITVSFVSTQKSEPAPVTLEVITQPFLFDLRSVPNSREVLLLMTNHTANAIQCLVEAIEVENGGNWTNYKQTYHNALFIIGGNMGPQASAMIPFSIYLPGSGAWRIRLVVISEVTGVRGVCANLICLPKTALLLLKRGGNVKQLNPFRGHWKTRTITTQPFPNPANSPVAQYSHGDGRWPTMEGIKAG